MWITFLKCYNKIVSIVFSEHAKQQLSRRKIPQKLVVDTVRNCKELFSGFKGRKLRRKIIGDKLLEVVTITEGSRIIIITGYYLEE